MAKFDGKYLTGAVGPAVYKKYRNMQLVTAKSRLSKETQTENTKRAATQFGISSRLAADLRKNFENIVTDFYDGTMVYRFKTLVQQSLRQALDRETGLYQFTTNSFEKLNGFEFNTVSPVINNFFVQPVQTINGSNLTISIPEMYVSEDVCFPRKASSCMLNVAIGMYDLHNGYKSLCPVQSVEIDNDKSNDVIPAQELTFEIEPGCLCISMFFFQYFQKTFSGNLIMNSKQFNPAAVFRAVVADGVVDKGKTEKWQAMTFRNLPETAIR